MANWSDLKAAVASIIKTNGNKEITGQLLQNVLNNIISNVGSNSSFAGIANPETNPGTPDGNVFYLATKAGTYSNFNGIVIKEGEAVILEWKGSWTRSVSGFATKEDITELESKVGLNFDVRWRGNRRIYYNPTDKSLNIIGERTMPTDTTLCLFKTKGIFYTITDSVKSLTLNDIVSGNTGLFLPESKVNATYTLNDIVVFNDDYEHEGYIKIAHITWASEIDSNIVIKKDQYKFDVSDNIGNVDFIFDIGVYKIKHSNAPYILSVSKLDNGVIVQQRTFTNNSNSDGYNVQTRYYTNGVWSNWVDVLKSRESNPILKNHSQEFQYFGDARLKWNSEESKLYVYGNVPPLANGKVVRINVGGKTFYINNSVKERIITDAGNYQLLIPIDVEAETEYSLNDILVSEGTTWNTNKYVKLGHLIFAKGMSSFIIEHVDNEVLDSIKDKFIDVHSALPNYDFTQDIIIGGNIGADGVLGTYTGRGAFFFRMKKKGVAPIINGTITILAYQWYSDFPDYVNGSNSLGRTTTNTPPANAMYCGVTLWLEKPYENITIGDITTALAKDGFGNNSVGETMFADGVIKKLRILGYGNSFMRNSVHFLSAIAKGVGVDLTVGNLYIGGVNLSSHLSYLKNGGNPYEYHKYENGVAVSSLYNQTAKEGLLDERWDIVILHQYLPTPVMPNYEPFEPYLSEFINKIIEVLGYCPKFYLNATWAGSLDSNETYYGYNTELEMWEAVRDANIQASKDSGIINIIPTGTAIQNARTLSYADSYNRFVNKENDDYHHLNPAGGFIAACTIYEKIIYPLNKVHCNGTLFRLSEDIALPPQWVKETGIYITDSNVQSMCNAAIKAVENPNSITILEE